MNYPTDATSSNTGIRAVSGDSILLGTTTSPYTILHWNFQTTAQNSQLIQCRTNNNAYQTLNQAIGVSPSGYGQDVFIVLPVNTVCYLRTFNSTLSSANLILVPYDLSLTPTSTGSITSTTTASSSQYLSADKTADVFFFGIILFFIMVYYWKDRFKVDRYE